MTKLRVDDSLPLGEPAEHFLEDFLNLSGGMRVRLRTAWRPAIDVFDVGGAHVVVVELAGVRASDVEVSVQGRRLRIAGVRRPPPIEHRGVQELEIDYGPFERTISLDGDVDEDATVAEYRHGLLLVKVPRKRAPGRVDIRVEE